MVNENNQEDQLHLLALQLAHENNVRIRQRDDLMANMAAAGIDRDHAFVVEGEIRGTLRAIEVIAQAAPSERKRDLLDKAVGSANGQFC